MTWDWISFFSDGFAPRLGVALVCGALIGAERQWRGRPAGVRTHLLVAVGSVVFTYLSRTAFGNQADASRVAAQIVSGIGFLGAGVIMRRQDSIQGLNTASTLWVVAALGMAAGVGSFAVAWLSTGAILAVQIGLRPLGSSRDGFSRPSVRYLYEISLKCELAGLPEIQEWVRSLPEEVTMKSWTTRLPSGGEAAVLVDLALGMSAAKMADAEPYFLDLLQRPALQDIQLSRKADSVHFWKVGGLFKPKVAVT